MAQHAHYWSCSKFANKLRGTDKPWAATMEEWDDWHKKAETAHPIRYWMSEELLGKIQDAVTYPARVLKDARYYYNNRWVCRTNSLTAHPSDIKPGAWRDVGNRFLPCMFNELVDFVEIELAWMHVGWKDKADQKKYNIPGTFKRLVTAKRWRSAEAGLANLNWACELIIDEDVGVTSEHKNYGKPTGQAINSMEIRALYLWWTTVYKNRPDPFEASGLAEFYKDHKGDQPKKRMRSLFRDMSKEDKKERNRLGDLKEKISAQYEKEDTAMLIRLVKIRNSLWS